MRKTTFLLGATIGYVLGARAGRRRYEQISALAGRLWGSPQVQHAKVEAQNTAKDAAKSATINLRDSALNSSAAASVKTTAAKAATMVKDRLPGSSGSSDAPAADAPLPPAPVSPVSTTTPRTTPSTGSTPGTTATTTPGTMSDRTPNLNTPKR